MIIKVKHILIIIGIVLILFLGYILSNGYINEMITKMKYEKLIINNYNNNTFESVTEGTIEEYSFYKNYYNEPNIDISPLIESYIKQVETNEMNPYNSDGLSVEVTSNMEREIKGWDYTYLTALYYGKDRMISIDDLEKILVHTSNDKYSGWCIPKDSPNIIELPYNFYLKYEPSDFKLLDNVKKITKCEFIDSVTKHSYNGRKRVIISYVDSNDESYTIDSIVFKFDNDDKIGMPYSGIFYKRTKGAKIELCNHYSDLTVEEWQRVHADDIDDVYWEWDSEECKAIIDKFR